MGVRSRNRIRIKTVDLNHDDAGRSSPFPAGEVIDEALPDPVGGSDAHFSRSVFLEASKAYIFSFDGIMTFLAHVIFVEEDRSRVC